MNAMEPKNASLKTRRILAVILTALTLLCLFWPPVMAVRDAESRSDAEERFRAFDADARSKETESIRNTMTQYLGFSDSDAEKYAKAAVAVEQDSFRPTWSIFHMRSHYTNRKTLFDLSRKYGTTRYIGYDENEETTAKTYSALLNILMFGMAVFGAAAIIQYLRNASGWCGVLFAVLTAVCAIVAATAVPKLNDAWSDRLDYYTVSIGLFLTPALALAARILYRKEVSAPSAAKTASDAPAANLWGAPPTAGSASVKKPEPTVSRAESSARRTEPIAPAKRLINRVSDLGANPWDPAPKRDAHESAPKPAAPAGPLWTCQLCGRKNPMSEEFCPSCNTKRF